MKKVVIILVSILIFGGVVAGVMNYLELGPFTSEEDKVDMKLTSSSQLSNVEHLSVFPSASAWEDDQP